VLETERLDLEAFAPESSFHVCVHPEFIAIAIRVASTDRGMMADLLGEELVGRSLELKRFSKNWIERLAKTFIRALILDNTE
jgi:hypothetical protein